VTATLEVIALLLLVCKTEPHAGFRLCGFMFSCLGFLVFTLVWFVSTIAKQTVGKTLQSLLVVKTRRMAIANKTCVSGKN